LTTSQPFSIFNKNIKDVSMHYIFGSWFDPFTHAHEEIIKTIHKKLRQNDKFHILVTDNDEKKNRTSVEERCNMVRNAL